MPPNFGKAKPNTRSKFKISDRLENSIINEEPVASENQLDEEGNMKGAENNEFNQASQVISAAAPPQPPPIPPCPSGLLSHNLPNGVPPPPPPPLVGSPFTTPSVPQLLLPPPPPPPPPMPVDYLNNSQSISELIKSNIEVSSKTHGRNENKNKPREFDINEIKTFKFNTNKQRKEIVAKRENKPTNTWENLMDEIRMNPSEKLRKVTETDKQSRINKHKALENYNNMDSDSRLLRDLNQILNQRSKFFNEDDDDDENGSSSSEAWDSSNEN